MPRLFIQIGPPGSGKSTDADRISKLIGATIINQDTQQKMHLTYFEEALSQNQDIIVDRMNFNKEQRERYVKPAKEKGYEVIYNIFRVDENTCIDRCNSRYGHPTIKDDQTARKAIGFFFSKYEKPTPDEGYTSIIDNNDLNLKKTAIIVDLDGTLCNIDHRLHFVKKQGKKDWKSFFENMVDDKINTWCKDIIDTTKHPVILVSGRPDDYKKQTEKWLKDHDIKYFDLFMRKRHDMRPDHVVKEIIYDFNIAPYYDILYTIDDRASIVNLWRSKGLTCLACADGDF